MSSIEERIYLMRGIIMKNNDELLELMIKEEYEKEAMEEEAGLLKDDAVSLSVERKEALFLKITEAIENFEKEDASSLKMGEKMSRHEKAGLKDPIEKTEMPEEEQKPEIMERARKLEEEQKPEIMESAGKPEEEQKPEIMERARKLEEEQKSEPVEKAGKLEEEIERQGKKEPWQQDHLYANMSEEDLKALAIGRRVMEEEEKAKREGKVVRKKKKRIQMYVGLAAVLVLVMAVGVTSMGGPEKIIKMMTQMVGNRNVEQVDSSEDNLVIVDGDEIEAYQKIGEEFGVDPVRLIAVFEDIEFVSMRLDEVSQTAELYYEYKDKRLSYLISASYKKGALGFEIADEVIDEYVMEVDGKEIEIKKYQVANEDEMRYSASFKERGLKYFLYGIMEQPEFELIVENLHFFS